MDWKKIFFFFFQSIPDDELDWKKYFDAISQKIFKVPISSALYKSNLWKNDRVQILSIVQKKIFFFCSIHTWYKKKFFFFVQSRLTSGMDWKKIFFFFVQSRSSSGMDWKKNFFFSQSIPDDEIDWKKYFDAISQKIFKVPISSALYKSKQWKNDRVQILLKV